jgi:arsenate reductase-like glutaredoxin family protein
MSEIKIKISDLGSSTKTVEMFSKNIPRYIEYLEKNYLPEMFDIFQAFEYDVKNFFSDEDELYYDLHIDVENINTTSVHEILEGPIKKLYELDGVVDVKLHTSSLSLIFFAPFFLQENLFASFEAIDKFNL